MTGRRLGSSWSGWRAEAIKVRGERKPSVAESFRFFIVLDGTLDFYITKGDVDLYRVDRLKAGDCFRCVPGVIVGMKGDGVLLLVKKEERFLDWDVFEGKREL